MERTLRVDDLVSRKANEAHVGVVERTHVDVDTHLPYPESQEAGPINHDKEIIHSAFRQFKRDGVPPKGTVLVRWQNSASPQLILERKLKLLGRSLLVGDVVRKNAKDAISGVVINTFTTCTLQPICDVTSRGQRFKGLMPTQLESAVQAGYAHKPQPLLEIPVRELQDAQSQAHDDLVIYKDWIGRVVGVQEQIVLKLADNCVVEIEDDLAEHLDGSPDEFVVGDIASTKKGHLRTGNWIFGRYNANTQPVGTVVQTRPTGLEIIWLQRRIGSVNEDEPPTLLEREELESALYHLYERTRRPTVAADSEWPEGVKTTVSNSEMDVRLGQRVRFKDLAGACVKYDGSTTHGKLVRLERTQTAGYDLNVFDIIKFQTDVVVQWQDLTVTREHSIDLEPDDSIDDEHEVWPGEVAHTLDMVQVPGVPGVETPSRVGVVQSVTSADRMARIRWAPDAVIHYSVGSEEEPSTMLTGAVGMANGGFDDVSLYDVEAPAEINVRRGDIVLIADSRGDSSGTEGREWLGEIVDTCLDGTLIVRLGAAATVRDVTLRREDVVVAVRSDGTDDVEDWDGEEEDDDDSVDIDDAPEVYFDELGNIQIREDDDEHEEDDEDDDMDSDEDEEARARYEDENGNPMEEDEVEDEEWESEDDEDMPDALQQTPPTSHSASPPEPSVQQQDHSVSLPLEDASPNPPAYHVLDEPVPASHRYADEPSTDTAAHVKRTQKEHKILQKPGALPAGVYVRTWESRLDLFRVLFIGPADTPYANAPFVVDFYLPSQFPTVAPQAFFHSWPSEQGLGGVGKVNPNLYEDGTICLSLLGTWEGNKGESWNASRSTLLQVIVSLLGLVLVKEPYFNEAGYEPLQGLESSKRPSALYSERAFLRARTFIITALMRLGEIQAKPRDLEGLEDAIRWSYLSESGPRCVDKAAKDVEEVLNRSAAGNAEPDGLTVMSKGACIPLRRVLERLRQLQ